MTERMQPCRTKRLTVSHSIGSLVSQVGSQTKIKDLGGDVSETSVIKELGEKLIKSIASWYSLSKTRSVYTVSIRRRCADNKEYISTEFRQTTPLIYTRHWSSLQKRLVVF